MEIILLLCFIPAWTPTCPGMVLSSAGLSWGSFPGQEKGINPISPSFHPHPFIPAPGQGWRWEIRNYLPQNPHQTSPVLLVIHPLSEVGPAWIQGFIPADLGAPGLGSVGKRLNFFVFSGILWQFRDKWTQMKPSSGKIWERPAGIFLCGTSWWPHPLGNLPPWESRESPVGSDPEELTSRAIKSRESHLPRNP